jgi:integrase
MPRPRLLHVHQQFGRKGQSVWYFRVGQGPRTRLNGTYGSPEFQAHYKALMTGAFAPALAKPKGRDKPGFTIRWLFDEYRKGAAWTGLKDSTRRQRDRLLYAVLQEAGDELVSEIDQAAIVRSLAKRRETPHQANHLLKTLRHVFDWAVAEKKVDVNPCERVKPMKLADDGEEEGHKTWSEEELARFEARWPVGSRERLVYALLLYTGLRLGDAARIGRQHLQKDGTLQIKTEKKGVVVYLEILPPLLEAIAKGPKPAPGVLAFLTHSRGQAFAKESLGNWFRDAVRAAGLTERSAHGLRKAAARRLAEAGMSEAILNAIFGWNDPRMAALYVREASKKRLAIGNMGGMVRAETVNILFPHIANVRD